MKQILLQHLLLKARASFLTKRTRLTCRLTFSALLLFGWAFTAFAQSPCGETDYSITHYVIFYVTTTHSDGYDPITECVEYYGSIQTISNIDLNLMVKTDPTLPYPEVYFQGSTTQTFEGGGSAACSRSGYQPPRSERELRAFGLALNQLWWHSITGAISSISVLTTGASMGHFWLIRSESLDDLYNFVKTNYNHTREVNRLSFENYKSTIVGYFNSKQLEDLLAQGVGAQLPLVGSSLPECFCDQTVPSTCYRTVTCPDGNYGCYESYPCTRSVCDKDEQKPPCNLEPTIKVRAQ